MKTIGLIGGMSWESSDLYYQHLNHQIQQRLGGLHSAKVMLYSVDFSEIEQLQVQGQWDQAGMQLADIAMRLQQAGADVIALCTNTMHKVAAQIEQQISIPFLHIADATIRQIQQQGIQKVGLLGTAFTMEQDFYKSRLLQSGLEVMIPVDSDRKDVHDIIYDELCQGKIMQSSRQRYIEIVQGLIESGAQGIIMGCTEIGMLIGQESCAVPLFDTTRIHVDALADFSLS
ncbi:aspartate/glutamate racemase family protein [Acinetobacter sp. WZC-1]|uniref:aspartate/glutamate racemase family protein n=1 Tax=Acinetobacter sp. WZC-1 TaxID=3459034 RepID=UPI00403DDC38